MVAPVRILFVAPLPPPVNGQSIVSQRLLDHLRERHEVVVVNIRKKSLKEGIDSLGRVAEILDVLRQVARHRSDVDLVYVTIAESMAGNLKDLVICLLPSRRARVYIHLHGGSIRRLLYDRHRVVYWLNKLIFGRIAGAIVSGPSHTNVFDGILAPVKVHIAANYADDSLFVSSEAIAAKFANLDPIRILYISHMIEGKGYQRLIDAFFRCSEATKRAITIDFAGAFDSDTERDVFLGLIRSEERVRYHGVVDTETKRSLLASSHAFCLPSSYFEGQPISILEAYASGCVVLATGKPGIRDVFTHDGNGYELEPNTPEGIASVIDRLVSARHHLMDIALGNRRLADEQYRAPVSMGRISRILEQPASA